MVAIARIIGQQRTLPVVFQGTWPMLTMTALLLAVLMSAIAVIYVKDTHRRLVAQLQALQHQQELLQVEKGQLLLEYGALTTQARVQDIAQGQLEMIFPAADAITVVDA